MLVLALLPLLKAKHQMGLYRDGAGNDWVIPSFVVAPLLVMIFAIILHWLPGGGWNGGALKFMILPMVALSPAYIASIARITRGSMIEVLHSNFIRTARAKGLPMGGSFTPRIKTCSVTRALLYGARICRHYYRFDGHRNHLWFTGDWAIVC